jgi:hypothetical protein
VQKNLKGEQDTSLDGQLILVKSFGENYPYNLTFPPFVFRDTVIVQKVSAYKKHRGLDSR